MGVSKTAVLLGALVLLGSAPAPAPAPAEGGELIVALAGRNAGVKSYTFDLSVNVKMQTFPWLNFHLDGTGEYHRPNHYLVRFKRVPYFGKGFEQVSMAPLDPKNWPQQYTISATERSGDATVVVMHDRVKSPLSEMRATVDPKNGVSRLVWTYNYGGRIQVDVTPQEISGIPFPANEEAQIIMPQVRAVAHADFRNYRVVVDEAPPSF